MINTTVSEAPITFVELDTGEALGFVAHCRSRIQPTPLRLRNGHFLYLWQLLGLRREERYLTTLEYRYVYQATPDDDSWIFRYEYQREPPNDYPYPRAHMHINASPDGYAGDKDFADLHLPTGERVKIESVVRHLISEHGIEPISSDWQEVVARAEDDFAEIQRKRILDPAPK